jgi:hypothetical protein
MLTQQDRSSSFTDTEETSQSPTDQPPPKLAVKKKTDELAAKRMSISLNGPMAEVLDKLSRSQNITQNEALRKAIGTEDYIREEIEQGSYFLVIRPDGEKIRVVFR